MYNNTAINRLNFEESSMVNQDDDLPDSLKQSVKELLQQGVIQNLLLEADAKKAWEAFSELKSALEAEEYYRELSIFFQQENTRKNLFEQGLQELYGTIETSKEAQAWLSEYLQANQEQKSSLREKFSEHQKRTQKTEQYCLKNEQRILNYAEQGRFLKAQQWLKKLQERCELFPDHVRLQQKAEHYSLQQEQLQQTIEDQKTAKKQQKHLKKILLSGKEEKAKTYTQEYLQHLHNMQSQSPFAAVGYFEQLFKEAEAVLANIGEIRKRLEQQQTDQQRTQEELKNARKKMAKNRKSWLSALIFSEAPFSDQERKDAQQEKEKQHSGEQINAVQKDHLQDDLAQDTKHQTVTINTRQKQLREDDAQQIIQGQKKKADGTKEVSVELHRPESRGPVDSVQATGLEAADRATEMLIESQKEIIEKETSGETKRIELERIQQEQKSGGRMAALRGGLGSINKKAQVAGKQIITDEESHNTQNMSDVIDVATSNFDQSREAQAEEKKQRFVMERYRLLVNHTLQFAA